MSPWTACVILVLVGVVTSGWWPGAMAGGGGNGNICSRNVSIVKVFDAVPPASWVPTSLFGAAVALSDTDDIIVISAPAARTSNPATREAVAAGAIFPYRLDKNTNQWVPMQDPMTTGGFTDHYGSLSALPRGDELFVSAFGTPLRDIGSTGPAQDFRGSFDIWTLDRTTWTYSLKQSINASTPGLEDLAYSMGDAETGAKLGVRIEVDRVGHEWLIVTCHGQDKVVNGILYKETGAAYVFKKNRFSKLWEFRQRLDCPDGPRGNYTYFGYDVAINGNWLAVSDASVVAGTPSEPVLRVKTSVWMYKLNRNGVWEYKQKLQSDQTQQQTLALNLTDGYGCEVSIDGNWMMVSACFESTLQQTTGAVYFYNLRKNRFGKEEWCKTQKFYSDQPVPRNSFGLLSGELRGRLAVVADACRFRGPEFHVGAVATFTRVDSGPFSIWVRGPVLTYPGGRNYDFFGSGAAIGGVNNRFVAGGTFPGLDFIFGPDGRGPPITRDPTNPATSFIPGYAVLFTSPCGDQNPCPY